MRPKDNTAGWWRGRSLRSQGWKGELQEQLQGNWFLRLPTWRHARDNHHSSNIMMPVRQRWGHVTFEQGRQSRRNQCEFTMKFLNQRILIKHTVFFNKTKSVNWFRYCLTSLLQRGQLYKDIDLLSHMTMPRCDCYRPQKTWSSSGWTQVFSDIMCKLLKLWYLRRRSFPGV